MASHNYPPVRARRLAACRAALCALAFVGSTSAAAAEPHRASPELPPLIDRELFFGDPEITGAQLSPDGKYVAFIKPLNGTRNVWVKRTEESFDAARPVTADTARPIPGFFWSRDGKYILFVQDKAGDENYNVYAVNPADPPAQGVKAPAARNLTDAKGARAFIYAVPKNEPDTMYVGLNDRDPAWHDLYKVSISTGERALVRKNGERVTSWVFDLTGKLRLATRSAENGDTEVLRVDPDGFKKVYSCTVFETCAPVRFHKDGQRVYMITNKGDDVDLTRLVLFDPQTGKEELVESDPMKRVDLGNVIFSEKTDELIATAYDDDRERILWKDPSYEADYKLLQQRLPGRDIGFDSATLDERLWLISADSDTEPGEKYLFDRGTKKVTLQYKVFEKLPRAHLAEMKPIRYPSSDGLEIPAFLTLPKGVPAKGLPLVVVPHGGPWGRDSWGYDAFAQFLANRGYAVLQPNFRASVGFGKKFVNAGNNEWGQKMQDDLTWGVKHLVSKGLVDPKRVAIMGGSYGGYATLAGLAFTPDVYAAGVSIVGPSNLITLLDSIPPYWEAIRNLFFKRMGDPSTPEGKAQLERQSPLNSADKIKAPLLVVQGANDPRVKKAESDQIVVALRERGFAVEYLLAPDEGHGFARPVNNLAMFASAEKFLAKHIGGRHQEGMTDEVSKRLSELTVDVKKVELAKKIDAASVGAPKPAVGLTPGSASYNARIDMGGQSIALTVTATVKEENGAWVVTEIAKTPMGEVTDTTVLEKGSLIPTKRAIKQGPMAIDLEFSGNKATGKMSVNGQDKPISADTGGALFADGAGAHQAMASLPLADGYTATYRNFDVQSQKAKLMRLAVVAIESVTVPAGTFEAYKVEATSAEGDAGKTIVWIDKATRKVIKTSATLPQMNGATLTSELAQ
jgi:dipeptidyl aminopeptidase/acylaminoacyl peptidase